MSRRLIVEADGGSRGNPGPAGYGTVVRDAAGAVLVERAKAIGRATNNVAEYEGLIAGLRASAELSPSAVEVRMDSKLVVEQMAGRWQVKHPSMRPLADTARRLVRELGVPVRFTWIPRARNSHADRLANEAMDAAAAGREWSVGKSGAGSETVEVPEPEPAAGQLTGWQDRVGPPTTTLLLRHGQTALSVDRRFSGLGAQELTAYGAAQAVRTAEHLAACAPLPDAVIASPLRRAAQTAAAVATALGVDVETEEGLRETDFGDWQGYTFAEVRQRWPGELDAWLADPGVAPPYGESFTATTTRVQAALSGLLTRHAGRTLVVVSHVTPVKTLLRLALMAPPAALYRMHLDLCSLSEVQWYADGPAVVRSLNDTCHLDGLADSAR